MDEDALICDMAEYYSVLEYKKLPVTLVASLVSGLRDESRTKMMLTGTKIPLNRIISAAIYDKVSLLLWAKTKDASKNRNRPKSLVKSLTSEPKKDIEAFATCEDFIKRRDQLIKEMEGRDGN